MRKQTSGLRFYSFAIVTADKPVATDIIEVSPTEELPLIDGPLGDHQQNYNFSLPDAKGVINLSNITGGGTVTANWWPLGTSNRISSPDVYKGETVMLLKYADVEDLYWITIWNEPALRKLETVCYIYSNQRTPLKKYDKNSSYWFQIDTRNKKVQLHTCANDGEATEYDILLDTGSGQLVVKDSNGNFIVLYSVDGKLVANINKEADISVPITNWTGNINLMGNLVVKETVTVEGTTTMNSDVTVNANQTISGNLGVTGTLSA